MKYVLSLLLLLFAGTSSGQISFPKGFRLIKGSTAPGEDDIYTNGKYSFPSRLFFRSYHTYSCIVVDWSGEAFELFSGHNGTDFSRYSKWLLSSIKEYRKTGKWFIFPRRIPK